MKKNVLKLLVTALLVISLFGSMSVMAFAYENEEPAAAEDAVEAEETEWVFRVNENTGKLEKRLWSCTYIKWLTDWILA